MHKQIAQQWSGQPASTEWRADVTWLRNDPVGIDNDLPAICRVALDIALVRQAKPERIAAPAELTVNPVQRTWYEQHAALFPRGDLTVGLAFDEKAQAAVDAAKRATPEGVRLSVGVLLAAAFHVNGCQEGLDALKQYLNAPKPVREQVEKVPLDEPLQAILNELAARNQPVTTDDLLQAILQSDAGQTYLREQGMPEAEVRNVLNALGASSGDGRSNHLPPADWRSSSQRRDALRALGSFGRMLTESPPPARGTFDADGPLRGLITTLTKMKRHNAIVVGHPGTGKTAIVYELARRMAGQDESLPPRLRDMDLFELSPAFLRSGASVVGEYEKRIKELLSLLGANPKIIVFVDEIHSMFQSGVHGQTPWTEGNEAFKSALGHGEIACIGATTWSEYRHYIEPDGALTRRFDLIRLEPPTAARTEEILRSRLPEVAKHYAPLRIDEVLLERVVSLTDEHLPSRYQPDKSIQLLDQACALCVTSEPPRHELTESDLFAALEQSVGHRIVRTEALTETDVLQRLRCKIVGQDAVLEEIARAFAAGLGPWGKRKGPRSVFLFGGPTGVGKTEVALMLGRILGGDRDALIRIDCNTLQSVGSGGSAVWQLLGVPHGFAGYARGQGGLLSRIRDMPECIVLFDEFEKADPSVGEVLLRILDEGLTEDVDGNVLDFRRSFVIFTTNAGCQYAATHQFGFVDARATAPPSADLDDLHRDLRRLGLGQEFLGRIKHTFLFQGLGPAAVKTLIGRHLEALAESAGQRGFTLTWPNELVVHLASAWQPQFGVRHLAAILRNRVIEQLNLADAHGQLTGLSAIEIRPLPAADDGEPAARAGFASRERVGDRLVIYLA